MEKLQRSIYILLFLFLLFGGLYFARQFLIPVTLAAILSMLLVRFSNYLEAKRIPRGWSALICVLLLILLLALIAYLFVLGAATLREALSPYVRANGVWAPSSTWFVTALNR